MNICEGNRKYIVLMDTEDLSFLPLLNTYSKLNDNIMPIWSRSNLKQRYEDSYYEFELKDVQDISDNDTYISSSDSSSQHDSNIEADIEMGTNLCFICNLEVPLPYARAHIDSPKHKTFLKIAEIALERVKKQMSQNYATENPNPSMYFCQTCVAVVPVKDKSHHVKSKAHKNAKILDKLLEDLLALYSDEALENDDHDKFEIESSKCDELDKADKTVKFNVINKLNDVESDVSSVEMPVKIINKEAAKEALNDQTPVKAFENINNNDTNLTEYFNIMNSFTFSTHKVHDVNGEYLRIETVNGDHLKVKHDNFHGILRIGDCHHQCKLCVVIIKNKKEHIYSTGHMEKITLPIKDNHGIRELGDTKNHCILCNDFVENADAHIHNNEVHKAQLKNAHLTIENIENQKDGTIVTAFGSLEKNKNEKLNDEVIENKGIVQADDWIPKNLLHEKVIKKHSVLLGNESVLQACDKKINITERTESFCSVCYIKIEANDLNSHASSANHKLNEKLNYHYLLKYDAATNKLKCKICSSFVHIDFITDHLKSPDHVDNYKALLVANEMSSHKENVNCVACTVYMRIGNELLHISSTKHRTLLTKQKDLIVEDPLKDSCDDSIHFCDVCQVKVPNNRYNIDTHYNGKSHNKKLASQKNVDIQRNEESAQAVKTTDVKLSNVSKTKVPLDVNKVTDKIYSSILKETETKIAKDRIIAPPEVLAGNIQPLNIVNIPVMPVMPIANEGKTVVSKENNKSNNVKQQETSGDNKKKSVIPSGGTDIMEITTNPKELMCKICNVIIPNKTMNITEHLIGHNHANNIRVLKENHLKLMGNLYFCNGCREYVTMKDQFNHINERSHAVNMVKTVAKTIVDDLSTVSDSMNSNKSASDTKTNVQTPSQSTIPAQSNSVKTQQNTHSYFEFKLTDAPYELLCEVCNVKVPNSASTLNMHIEGIRHNSQLKTILLKNKIKEENGNFECSVCFMELSKFELLHHIKKKYHITSLAKNGTYCIENNYCNICDTTVSIDNIEEHCLSKQHSTNEEQKEQLKNNVCEICDVQLTNNVLNIHEHNNGSQHKNNIKLMEENNIEMRENKCFCKCCDEHISNKSIQEHIRTAQHLMLSGSDDVQ